MLAVVAAGLAGGCGGTHRAAAPSLRSALASYMREVEPVRLGVNRLLEGADPILEGFRSHRLSAAAASQRMDALEWRFAAYTVQVFSIAPKPALLAKLQAEYAQTYVLEDAYLSALVSGLAERDFDALPDTQARQRATIIRWRTGLTVLARMAGYRLPADLQQAGRGEIAPSPGGS